MYKTLFFALALGIAAIGPAKSATIFFDGFETNRLGTPTRNLTQNIAGWTVTSGTIDVIGTGYFGWYGAGRYLDMNGSTRTPGRIETTIRGLTAGKTYRLGFSYGYNKFSGTNEQLSFGIANLSGAINKPDFDLVRGATMGTAVFSFKASAAAHRLFFADTGSTWRDNGGAILDNVSVSSVPLPAGLPMLLAGFGALALLRRRRA